jgi:hypothetical protein
MTEPHNFSEVQTMTVEQMNELLHKFYDAVPMRDCPHDEMEADTTAMLLAVAQWAILCVDDDPQYEKWNLEATERGLSMLTYTIRETRSALRDLADKAPQPDPC